MGEKRQTNGMVGRRGERHPPLGAGTAEPAGNPGDKPPLGALFSKGKARAARVQPRGCKGRSPLHEITLVSPFPLGRALCERGRGDGGKTASKWHGGQARRKTNPPSGAGTAEPAGNPGDKPPLGALFSKGKARAARVQPRGCKGRSPLHEITLVSPFPPGRALCERGSGGWGRQSKPKAGAAGDKKGKPPAGTAAARSVGTARGKPPHRVRDYATPSQCRPGSAAGLLHGKGCTCRRRSNAGDARGEAPCMK